MTSFQTISTTLLLVAFISAYFFQNNVAFAASAASTTTAASNSEDGGISVNTDGSSSIDPPSASPKIYTIGEPILLEKCRNVTAEEILFSEYVATATKTAHRALADFRKERGFGRAIASPQVGFALSFVALNLGEPETMFNPEITFRSQETFTMWDDCLSFPDLVVRVERHSSISVSFLNSRGEETTWNNCSRSLSELLQHEIDHLHGVLAVSRRKDPVNVPGIPSGLLDRTEWENNKEKYATVVDYAI